MLKGLVFAIPIAFVWMALSAQWSPGGFLVGYVVANVVLQLVGVNRMELQWRKLPMQFAALVVYAVRVGIDIVLCGLDGARRFIDPALPINPGIIAVSTQDESGSEALAALSAHAITITVGELVVEFEGNKTLYVHCLDVDKSGPRLEMEQSRRLSLLRKVLGHD